MDTLWLDVRYALRGLVKEVRWAIVVIAIVALGIGSASAVFSVVNGVLLSPLPYCESDRLVALFRHDVKNGEDRNPTSPADFADWREQSSSLEHMTAAHPWHPVLTGQETPARLNGLKASASLFSLLGLQPALGRTFLPEDGEVGNSRVIVLGHSLWMSRFGGRPDLIGEQLKLDGEDYTVVGVMPPGFRFPPFWATEAEMWVPLAFSAEEISNRGSQYLRVFARLVPDVSFETARAEMSAVAARLEAAHPKTNTGASVNLEPLVEPVVSAIRPGLLVMFAAAGLVLLISCVNVAHLLLVKAISRRKEVAVRRALGASRLRLARQVLTESTVLSLCGGTGGLLLAHWGVQLLVVLGPENIPRLQEITVDGRVFTFAVVLSLLTGWFFGLPVVARSSGHFKALKEGGWQSSGSTRQTLPNLIAVSEFAMALVLLISAGLLFRSYLYLDRLDVGFETKNLLTMDVSLAGSDHATLERQNVFFSELLARVEALPGVERATLVNHLPIGGDIWSTRFAIEGRAPGDAVDLPRAVFRTVAPGFFRTVGARLIIGRPLPSQFDESAPRGVIVNRTLAQRFFPGESVLGKRIKLGRADGEEPWFTIGGVVEDLGQWSLIKEIGPEIFLSYSHNPVSWWTTATLVVKSSSEPSRLTSSVRDAVWSLDPDLPVTRVRTMEQILFEDMWRPRFNLILLSVFATIALVLAVVGTYGVLSHSTAQRNHEMGVRLAMGASPRQIAVLVLRHGMQLASLGIIAGLAASLALSRFLPSILYGVKATDPLTFVGVSLSLAGVGALAALVPARRAAWLNPVHVIRNE